MNRIEGGRRFSGKPSRNEPDGYPVISIITVVLNNGIFLEKTIKSIISQTYPHIEFIIIDGYSSDGTLDIIRAYDDKISYWLSEKDSGIYDGMNKGLSCATGDYVWFINAGDQIKEPDTLKTIIRSNPTIDVYYGDTMLINKDDNFLGMRRLRPPGKLDWKSLGMGLVVCHQAILIKRELAGNYNLKYEIAADFDWVMNALKKSTDILNTEAILIKYLQEGFSRHHVALALKERFIIMRKNYGIIRTLYFHFRITARLAIFFIRKKLMPLVSSAKPGNIK
jgi:glycosyltransferase involved in cell wall biosynthesis